MEDLTPEESARKWIAEHSEQDRAGKRYLLEGKQVILDLLDTLTAEREVHRKELERMNDGWRRKAARGFVLGVYQGLAAMESSDRVAALVESGRITIFNPLGDASWSRASCKCTEDKPCSHESAIPNGPATDAAA